MRVWSLESDTLGWPVSILTGHTAAITYLDFSPVAAHALVSAANDGSFRLWDARAGGAAVAVLHTGAAFDAALRHNAARHGGGVRGADGGSRITRATQPQAEGVAAEAVRAGGAAAEAGTAGMSGSTARQQALAEAHASAVHGVGDQEGQGMDEAAEVGAASVLHVRECRVYVTEETPRCRYAEYASSIVCGFYNILLTNSYEAV